MRVDKKRDADSPRTWFFTTVPTKREAKALERKIKHEMETGVYFEPCDLIVGEYLRSWHEDHARHHTSARALESNGYLIERHIIPALGRFKLAKLRPMHLQSYYSEKLDSGLKDSSVRKHHNIIHAALKHAVRMQLLATNPADVVVPPRVVRGEMMAVDEKQSAAMLRAAAGTSVHMPLLLALSTGMRRGELLGLRWPDVDLEARTLVVNQTLQEAYGELHFKEPKTAKSRRRITLPALVVEALRAHRA